MTFYIAVSHLLDPEDSLESVILPGNTKRANNPQPHSRPPKHYKHYLHNKHKKQPVLLPDAESNILDMILEASNPSSKDSEDIDLFKNSDSLSAIKQKGKRPRRPSHQDMSDIVLPKKGKDLNKMNEKDALNYMFNMLKDKNILNTDPGLPCSKNKRVKQEICIEVGGEKSIRTIGKFTKLR